MQQLDPSHLKTIFMRELYNTVYQSKPPLIDGLLYPGTYIFAGAPKLGKSFLMAQLAYHISTGTPLWNFDVRKGTVLYLALEDDYHGSSTLVQPKTKFFNLATHWKMGFFYEIFCQI